MESAPVNPHVKYLYPALPITAILYLVFFFSFHPGRMVSYLLAINIVTFAMFCYDKNAAQREKERVPELVLQLLMAMGGSPGAFFGMKLVRHKSFKPSFGVVFVFIVLVQLLGLSYYLRNGF